MSKTIQKIVLVISSLETMEDVERWQFDVDCDKEASEDPRFVLVSFWFIKTCYLQHTAGKPCISSQNVKPVSIVITSY